MLDFEKRRVRTGRLSPTEQVIEKIFLLEDAIGEHEIIGFIKSKVLFADQPCAVIYFDENSFTIRNPLTEFKVSAFPGFVAFDTIEVIDRNLYDEMKTVIKGVSFKDDFISTRDSILTEEDGELTYINTEEREDNIYFGGALIYRSIRTIVQETRFESKRKTSEGMTLYLGEASIIKKSFTVESNGETSHESARYERVDSPDIDSNIKGESITKEEFSILLDEYKDRLGREKGFELVLEKTDGEGR